MKTSKPQHAKGDKVAMLITDKRGEVKAKQRFVILSIIKTKRKLFPWDYVLRGVDSGKVHVMASNLLFKGGK